MHLNKLTRLVASAALCAVANVAVAQHALQIIPLRHRTVEQVLPVLQQLLEPGGTLSGHSGQLFVRASPANVAELRRVLDTIDRPARRLQILVRFDDAADAARREIGANARIDERGARVGVRAEDAASRGAERIDQRVQVLEGGRATIYAGQSQPVRERRVIQTPAGVVSQETFVVQDRATGFDVVPRLSGGMVHVDISPQRESGDAFQRASTSVSARLGEWFEIGGAARSASREERGIAAARQAQVAESRRIWLKVEELP